MVAVEVEAVTPAEAGPSSQAEPSAQGLGGAGLETQNPPDHPSVVPVVGGASLVENDPAEWSADPPDGGEAHGDAEREPADPSDDGPPIVTDVVEPEAPASELAPADQPDEILEVPSSPAVPVVAADPDAPVDPTRRGLAGPSTEPQGQAGAVDGPDRTGPLPLPRVIAIANQKGGVGKTTTTVNLGAALAELGYRVLVIDLDPQGNATTGLGIDGRNFDYSMYDVIMRDTPLEDCVEPTSVKNLFVAPATIDLAGVEIELVPAFSRELKLKRAIDAVVDDFDFILIDCPPSLGLITVNGLAAAGEVLVPIQCEYYALEGLSQLLRNVQLVSTNLNATLDVSTIVLTMYDARTRLAVDVATEVRQHFADKVCQTIIPRTVRLSEAPSFGQPITVFDPTSRGAVAYRELAKEVSNGAPKRTG
jgi:chromosome partitioning protein